MPVDQELSALASVASLLPTDIIYLVRDPGGGAEADNKAPVSVIDARYASAAQGALADTALQAAAIGVSVQAYDVGLSAITAFGRSLIDDVDAAAGRATLQAAGTGVINEFALEQLYRSHVTLDPAMQVRWRAYPGGTIHTNIRHDGTTFLFNNNTGQMQFRQTTDDSVVFLQNNLRAIVVVSGQRVAIGTGVSAASAQLHVSQLSTTAAIPALRLDQLDLSEDFIEFNGTVATGNPIEAVGAKTLTTTHFLRVSVNGSFVYIPVGTIA